MSKGPVASPRRVVANQHDGEAVGQRQYRSGQRADEDRADDQVALASLAREAAGDEG